MRNMLFYCCILLSLIPISCATTNAVAEKITIKSGQIPPQMAEEKFILIGKLHNRKSYDKYVEEEFSSYTGDYVLATQTEIDSKYANKEKYRYVMDYTREDKRNYTGKDYNISTVYRYFILDRVTGDKFVRKGASGAFKLEIRTYLKAIESIRK